MEIQPGQLAKKFTIEANAGRNIALSDYIRIDEWLDNL